MQPLSTGIDYVDLEFLGEAGIIASVVLRGADGVAVIDPGPETTRARLWRELDSRGVGRRDVRAVLLTHIHLDHAGAAGALAMECPHAEVFVHPAGAPHLAHPAKLLASASRLYGADMARLWGDVHAVPADRLRPLPEGPLRVVGHDLEVAHTPGHASHHVSYFAPAASIAFVGDTAGICRESCRIVLPPTPPPDIDLDAWHRSTERILAWHPDVLFLTHFGPHRSPDTHFADLWHRMNDWTRRIRFQLQEPGDDETRAREFMADVMDELARTTSRREAQAYADAGRFDFSWSGLARYLRRTTAG